MTIEKIELDFSQRVAANEDVLVTVLDGESVLLNMDTELYFGLDQIGTRMWTLLTESASIQAAFELLMDEYDVDETLLRSDMVKLVSQWVDDGLITIHNG